MPGYARTACKIDGQVGIHSSWKIKRHNWCHCSQPALWDLWNPRQPSFRQFRALANGAWHGLPLASHWRATVLTRALCTSEGCGLGNEAQLLLNPGRENRDTLLFILPDIACKSQNKQWACFQAIFSCWFNGINVLRTLLQVYSTSYTSVWAGSTRVPNGAFTKRKLDRTGKWFIYLFFAPNTKTRVEWSNLLQWV